VQLPWVARRYPALVKLVLGINDLATLYPEVAKEVDGWGLSEQGCIRAD
jgi:hypothetical protein